MPRSSLTPPPPLPRSAMILGVCAVLVMGGCGARIPRVTPELVAVAAQRDAALTAEHLERARTLYVNRCGSCHGLSAPEDYDEREWRSWVRKMAPKAKLDRGQEADIVIYLLVARDAVMRAEAQGRQLP
jgi:hypothetical protein